MNCFRIEKSASNKSDVYIAGFSDQILRYVVSLALCASSAVAAAA